MTTHGGATGPVPAPARGDGHGPLHGHAAAHDAGVHAPGVSPAKLEALRAGARDLPAPGRVSLRETRSSWIVLHAHRAFKLKKPVRNEFIDLRSVDARLLDAREEVRFNTRLAPGIYLGVRALQRRGGRWRLLAATEAPAPGADHDWVVEMVRLPAERMLDRLIAAGTVVHADVDAIVDLLARFYRSAPAVVLDGDTYVSRLVEEHRTNVARLSHPALRTSAIDDLLARHGEALDRLRGPLADRARGGHLVEGHGDLRPEHVCLRDAPAPPVVIDGLSWSLALRQVDPYDELAALELECAVAGGAPVGTRVWAGCAEQLGGAPSVDLRHLYLSRRALLRARQALSHLLDVPVRVPTRWRPMARRYLREAEDALDALRSDARRRQRPGDRSTD